MNAPAERATELCDEGAAVRTLLEEWALAVRYHDLEGVTARHTPDVVYFDVPPPVAVHGLAGYRASWLPFFRYLGKSGQFEFGELTVTAGADIAFAHGLLLVRGESEPEASRVRLSVGLRKIRGQWVICHEHHSAAFALQSAAAAGIPS